jgi:NitT/TauT family transport system substrate-binding protein
MTIKRWAVVLTLVTAIVLSATASAAVTPQPAATQPHQGDIVEVKVGTVPVMIFAPLFVADAKGYFADENLVVEILRNPGGSEPLAPLATGELDVVMGGAGAGLFNYAQRNLDLNDDPGFRIVAGVHSEADPLTSPLVVSAERFESGEITSVADLAGGRVAINAPGAATEYWMAQALAAEDLTLEDVELVAVSFPDVAAALNSDSADRIDAAILGEPLVSFAEQEGLVVRLSEDFVDGFQATFLYMSNDFIENNREAAVGFIRAYVRAVRDLDDNEAWASDETAAILEEYTQVPAAINQTASRPYFPINGEVDIDDLSTLQDYFLEKGDLAYEEPLDIEVMVDDSLLEEVIADIGAIETDDDESEDIDGDMQEEATEEPSDS